MEPSARNIFHYLTRRSIEPVAPTPGPQAKRESLLAWNLVSLCFSLRRTQNNQMFNLLLLFPAPGFLWAAERAGVCFCHLLMTLRHSPACSVGLVAAYGCGKPCFRLFDVVRDDGVGFLLLKGYHIS